MVVEMLYSTAFCFTLYSLFSLRVSTRDVLLLCFFFSSFIADRCSFTLLGVTPLGSLPGLSRYTYMCGDMVVWSLELGKSGLVRCFRWVCWRALIFCCY